MTEAEWLACTKPQKMLEFLRGKASDRKLRLFVAACCRRIWHRIVDERCQQGIEGVETFADARTNRDRQAIKSIRRKVREAERACGRNLPTMAVRAAVGRTASLAAQESSLYAAVVHGHSQRELVAAEQNEQTGLLRDIFGNPFRPSSPLPPAVLAWNDGTVRRIAQGIYDERRMPEGTLDSGRLAILSDALLDAGCDNEELIAHCRSAGLHVRGSWAVDLILERK